MAEHSKLGAEASSSQMANHDSPVEELHETSDMHTSVPKTSKFKTLVVTKLGLDMKTVIIMFKAGLPPTIALAMYQSNAVAEEYSTLGYLVAIASVLGFAIMPRAKWFQTIILNSLVICLAGGIAMLGLWSAVKAREHTTSQGQPLRGYNASQSAVCAIWLAFSIFVVNWVRSARPEFNLPSIMWSIVVSVAFSNGPLIATVPAAESFVRSLLKALFTGFAIAAAVALTIFPTNTRQPVFGQMAGFLSSMRGVLKTQTAYLQGFEHDDYLISHWYQKPPSDEAHEHKFGRHGRKKGPAHQLSPLAARAQALRAAVAQLLALNGQLNGDITFAKREFAYGKMNADDIRSLHSKMQTIARPLIGLATSADLFERIAKHHHWDVLVDPEKAGKTTIGSVDEERAREGYNRWQAVMQSLHEPFAQLTGNMDDALLHVLFTLELLPKPKANTSSAKGNGDIEANGDMPQPGQPGFAISFAKQIQKFYDRRAVRLEEWCSSRGIQVPSTAEAAEAIDKDLHHIQLRQIFTSLFMDYLIYHAAVALLELVKWADAKVEDGTLKKKRFIHPGFKRIKKWMTSVASGNEHAPQEPSFDAANGVDYTIQLGSAFRERKDPEHLPPNGFWERVGNAIRIIPRGLRSEHAAFGLRATCAFMSLAIVAYLRQSQAFFVRQRLFWALIIEAFSMFRTSGASVFNFLLRLFGTFVAMVASFVIWYIVNGHTAGVLVFEYLWISFCFYFLPKKPQYIVAIMLSAVTTILIVGYELQVDKIGRQISESTGQPYYPIYELAPYRLAIVAAGLFVAYFWTIFPFPCSEGSELRRGVGYSLHLVAKFYSIMHESVATRVREDLDNLSDKVQPAGRDTTTSGNTFKGQILRHLEKARSRMFSQIVLLLQQLRTSSNNSQWEITFGGRFPRDAYDEATSCVERIVRAIMLIEYASVSLAPDTDSPLSGAAGDSNNDIHDEKLASLDVSKAERHPPDAAATVAGAVATPSDWRRDFQHLLNTIKPTSQSLTTRLTLLSNSLTNGSPLPPYLTPLEPFKLLQKLEQLDNQILSARHIAEPGYAAFAVMQIASSGIAIDVNRLTHIVKDLVGEVDFSSYLVGPDISTVSSTTDASRSSSNEAIGSIKGDKRD